MSLPDLVHYIQSVGVVGCLALALWAIVTRRIVTRGEFDAANDRIHYLETKLAAANEELRHQSEINVRMTEALIVQRTATRSRARVRVGEA